MKFENKTKQRAGLESIRKMIDSEVIQIDIGIGSQLSGNLCFGSNLPLGLNSLPRFKGTISIRDPLD